jgi:excisionase family DNA binding protein
MSTVFDNKYKTVSEAARILGISVQRVRQLIADEQLKAEPIHERLWAIPTKELERFRRTPRPDGVHKDKRAG